MKDAMKDASGSEVRRKRVKPKILKEAHLDAGLKALEALESSDVAPRPVQGTARTLVTEGIESIMRLRNRNVPLIRIYTDMRKASGMRISFATFAGYVSEAAKAKGIKLEKPKAEAGAAPRPRPDVGTVPTSVGTSTAVEEGASTAAERATATAAALGGSAWGCSRCEKESTRTEKDDGRAWWQCPGCRTFYADNEGKISTQRLTKKEG